MSSNDLAIGTQVLLPDGKIATVKFRGPTSFAPGLWLGLELGDATGKNDGSVQGVKYFDCPPGHGLFVRPSTVKVRQEYNNPLFKAPKAAGRSSTSSSTSSRASTPGAGPNPKRTSVGDASKAPRPASTSTTTTTTTKAPRSTPTTTTATAATTTAKTSAAITARGKSLPKPGMSIPSVSTKLGASKTSAIPSKAISPTRAPATAATNRRTSTPAKPAVTKPPASRPSSSSSQSGSDKLRSALKRNSISSSGSDESPAEDEGSPRQKKSVTFAYPLKNTGASTTTSTTVTPTTTSNPAATTPTTTSTKPVTTTPATTAAAKQPVTTAAAARPAVDAAAANREIEDLKAKLKILEKKRAEDREKLNGLQDLKNERDRFERIIQTLQVKYQGQGQELTELRKQVREANDKIREFEERQADLESALELATVDREMAEEVAETYKAELETAKDKIEVLQLEVDLLREENAELSKGMSPEELASTGWLQMVKENERLRDALIRLRDISREQEAELMSRVKDLEQDLGEFETIKHELETAKEQLAVKNVAIDELREQLDAARVQDDYVVRMEEAAHMMQEDLKRMKASQEYLEELAAINDELEANHVLHEKELQEEIEIRNTIIAEQHQQVILQQKANQDLEQTISSFRSLVAKLQGDLEDMRASQAVTETEAERLQAHTRAMEKLNSTLRNSAREAHSRALDLDLRRIQAQEVELRLEIVTLFLPDTFHSVEESVATLLRFKRVAAKADLLSNSLKERFTMPSAPGDDLLLVIQCGALIDFTRVACMCRRFVDAISHCSLEQFAKFAAAAADLQPVEKLLDRCIDKIRTDRLLEERTLNSELARTLQLLTHLGEVHQATGLPPVSQLQVEAAMAVCQLECSALELSAATTVLHRVLGEKQGDELADALFKNLDAAISQTRSAKVIMSKTSEALSEMRERSLSPRADTLEAFQQCEAATKALYGMAKDITVAVSESIAHADMSLLSVEDICRSVAKAEAGEDAASFTDGSKPFAIFLAKVRAASSQMADLRAICTDPTQLEEFELCPPPWVLSSEEHKERMRAPRLFEAEVKFLKSEVANYRHDLTVRESELETANLKIETLESRMRELKARAARLTEVETQLEAAKERVTTLTDRVDKQSAKLRSLELEREKWQQVANIKLMAAGAEAAPGAAAAAGAKGARVVDTEQAQLLNARIDEALSMIRYLKEENRRARMTHTNWLQESLAKLPSTSEQRKVSAAREAKAVLGELVNLASNASIYDMSALPADKIAWKPTKTTPTYHAAKQLEDFATWSSWQDDAIERLESFSVVSIPDYSDDTAKDNSFRAADSAARKKASKPIARLEIRVADIDNDENRTPRSMAIGAPADCAAGPTDKVHGKVLA